MRNGHGEVAALRQKEPCPRREDIRWVVPNRFQQMRYAFECGSQAHALGRVGRGGAPEICESTWPARDQHLDSMSDAIAVRPMQFGDIKGIKGGGHWSEGYNRGSQHSRALERAADTGEHG